MLLKLWNRLQHSKKIIFKASQIIVVILACVYGMYRFILYDFVHKPPYELPIEATTTTEDFLCDDYAVLFRIQDIFIDNDETLRMLEKYHGGELLKERGITDEYLDAHFIAVRVKYYIDYDHTKTFKPDGFIDRFVYLLLDTENEKWVILDASAPGQPYAESDYGG